MESFLLLVLGMNSKTSLKMTVASIKLLRNKRQAMVKQMRHDIMSGQDTASCVRVQLVLSLRFAFGYCIGSWCGFLYWT
ncbi:hypothetical protein EUGRSUZ_I00610 [Eucalyptus grandis]|uniref:Uncharacterized protein n=3 Tax=Eucalyptus grandis TaxID=71139 RepID=A0A059ALD5_EUCGR|nr:hypothetical protein EUGRSUZ_I00610 [Eucalyptus grandis]KAK3411857.1 hypothetical protein EUGRSUZ_I00610 [Eucalyptus grandis]